MDYSFYRYRKIDDYFIESLYEDSIYFSSLEYLNDPMEGVFEPTFSGNESFWKNFFKNYLRALFHAVFSIEFNNFESINIISVKIYQDLVDLEKLNSFVWFDCWEDFFKSPEINKLITFLSQLDSKSNHPISLSVLKLILSEIHIIAILFVKENIRAFFKTVKKRTSLIFENEVNEVIQKRREEMRAENYWESFYDNYSRDPRKYEELYEDEFTKDYFIYKKLSGFFSKSPTAFNNLCLLYKDFPFVFCNSLKQLMSPHFFSASFSLNKDISTMWSHYADNHRGVCLEFSPEIKFYEKKEDIAIDKHNTLYNNVEFITVEYLKKEAEIQKISFESNCVNLSEESKKYWNVQGDNKNLAPFKDVVSHKSNDWKYEKEIRALFSVEYDEPNYYSQGLKMFYDVNHLKAVYFGLHAEQSDIRKIQNILKSKNKTNIDLYKMYMDHSNIDSLSFYSIPFPSCCLS